MISLEVNTALVSYFSSLGSPYSSVAFYPMTGYADSVAPFITYYEYPGTQSEEVYFLRVSNVIYNVYDNDIDRGLTIIRALEDYLNVGDDVVDIKTGIATPSSYGTQNYRLTTSRLVSGTMSPPLERDGFAAISRNFRMVYVNA